MRKRKIRVKLQATKLQEEQKKIPFVVALANKILSILGFVSFIDRTVDWDPTQWIVSPGNLAKAVILSTFFDMRAPLYNIYERFEDIDTEFLFGMGVEPRHLNDDAIGRALDRIAEAKPERLYGTLCLTAYTIFKIAFNRLHSDTTTVSFYGEYEESGSLKIVKGYNKDHRAECKQVVVGKIVTEHGIPISVSLLVRALIQYKMRKGFDENTEPLPKVGWNGAKLQPNLTMKFMAYAVQNQYFLREDAHNYSYRFTNPKAALRIETLFRLMGLSVEELLE